MYFGKGIKYTDAQKTIAAVRGALHTGEEAVFICKCNNFKPMVDRLIVTNQRRLLAVDNSSGKVKGAAARNEITETVEGSSWTGGTLTVHQADDTITTFKSVESADIEELRARLDSAAQLEGPPSVPARPATSRPVLEPEARGSEPSPAQPYSGGTTDREPFPLAGRVALAITLVVFVNLVLLDDYFDVGFRVVASIVAGLFGLMPKTMFSLVWKSSGKSTSSRGGRITTPQEAEHWVASWMKENGYIGVKVTPPSGDAGLDVVADGWSVQVKRTESAVGRPVLQALVGAARPGTSAACFSSGGYTAGARAYARERGVKLFAYPASGVGTVREVR